MEPLKRIFNVLFIIGLVWIVYVVLATFFDGGLGESLFQKVSLIFWIGIVPVIILSFIRKAIIYIFAGKK